MHSTYDTARMLPAEDGAAIWNPAAAASWSIVFSPAFGSYLVMRNWEALGERRQAAAARKWFVFSLGLLAIQLLSSAINARLNSQSNLMAWVGILYLLAWCAGAVLPQALQVRRRFGAGYARKGWDHALLAAVAGGTAYFAVQRLFTLLFVALT